MSKRDIRLQTLITKDEERKWKKLLAATNDNSSTAIRKLILKATQHIK